jgi:hypothetical protein
MKTILFLAEKAAAAAAAAASTTIPRDNSIHDIINKLSILHEHKAHATTTAVLVLFLYKRAMIRTARYFRYLLITEESDATNRR